MGAYPPVCCTKDGHCVGDAIDGSSCNRVEQLDSVAEGLSYAPPPGAHSRHGLGTSVPKVPADWVATAPSKPKQPWQQMATPTPTPSRPDEPQNKVYVQFSNNFEGFMPYLLLITEEQGLMFTSLSSHSADFTLDPLSFITVQRIDYDGLMKDAFFQNLSRGVLARKSLQRGTTTATNEAGMMETCIRPPYPALVQVEVRRPFQAGKVLVFIAVQNEPLANDLVRGCQALKKKRVVDSIRQDKQAEKDEADKEKAAKERLERIGSGQRLGAEDGEKADEASSDPQGSRPRTPLKRTLSSNNRSKRSTPPRR